MAAMKWPISPGITLVGKYVKLDPLDPISDAPELFSALDDDLVWEHLSDRPEELSKILVQRSAQPNWHQWLMHANCSIAGLDEGVVDRDDLLP